jgi:hypothetical protein
MGQTTNYQNWPAHLLQGEYIMEIKNSFNLNRNTINEFLNKYLPKISADTLGWLAVVVLNCATIPTLLALMTGLSDRTPSLDMVLFLWASLVLLFGRAVVLKDTLNIITIGAGFMIQAVLMAMVLFK